MCDGVRETLDYYSHMQDIKGPLTGPLGELNATVWLLKQGYEVFHNVKAYGPADLVIWDKDTNILTPIDVKTVRPYVRQDGSVSYNLQRNARCPNVRYLGWIPEEDRFIWLDDE